MEEHDQGNEGQKDLATQENPAINLERVKADLKEEIKAEVRAELEIEIRAEVSEETEQAYLDKVAQVTKDVEARLKAELNSKKNPNEAHEKCWIEIIKLGIKSSEMNRRWSALMAGFMLSLSV